MKKIITIIALGTLVSCTTTNYSHRYRRYCIIVEDVKHIKNNKSKVKALRRWYWYPTQNVNIGDTVDVSYNEMIIPKF
jgi:uncharacterized protein YcfL